MKFILAKKLNMTQVFTEDGRAVSVTVLQALPNKVSLLRKKDKEGYAAVQMSLGKARREFRMDNDEMAHEVGQEIKAESFEPGDEVNISGVTKGRGFAGPMKRHGFHGAPASHGHDHPRAVGSIGQRFPQHVRPGLRMAGQMGNSPAMVKNSLIVSVRPAEHLLFVKGGVPGARGRIVKVSTTGKKKVIGKIVEYGHPTPADNKNDAANVESKNEKLEPPLPRN